MSKSAPYGLYQRERNRINKHLRFLDQGELTGSTEGAVAGAAHLALSLRDFATAMSMAIGISALAVAVVVGGVATNAPIAVLLIAYLLVAGVVGTVSITVNAQASAAQAARAVVEYRLETARLAHASPECAPTRRPLFPWLLRRRRGL